MDNAICWPATPFTRADLRPLDICESELRRALQAGVLRRGVRGVYVRADLDDDLETRARIVARAANPHHVITDRTAGWVHGVDTLAYAEHDGVPPVETCALRGHEPTTAAGADGRTRDLAPVDIMEVHGLRVTTPLRTALDLGCCLRRREAFAALCAFAGRFRLTPEAYVRELGRYRRRRGVVQLRGLVGLVVPEVESPREAWVLLDIADASLPLPEAQVWVDVDGVRAYRLDFAYRHAKVCVEYDGDEAHGSEEQRAHDEQRRAWLRAHGWIVIVVRSGDFTGAARDRWISELRAALHPAYSTRRW
jgi:uncharacterized protein DUF559